MSLCRRRHTATSLMQQFSQDCTKTMTTFVLSVPIRGMEDLVCQVGCQSGRWGCKLNPSGRRSSNDDSTTIWMGSNDRTSTSPTSTYVPYRKRPKNNNRRKQEPIPNLIAVPLGGGIENSKMNHSPPSHEDFAIHGTVAHIQCRILSIQTADSMINDQSTMSETVDNDHMLVFGQIIKAYVHEEYWDTTKNLFRPRNDTVPPYLTFFGSQTFGYVV
jgi:hypothetical protein